VHRDAGSDERPRAGEDWADAIIDMAAGSVGAHLRTVPPEDFRRAIDLMEMTVEAILSDLTMAAEIAGRRENRYHASTSSAQQKGRRFV
jgi:hypothetical protein